MHRLFPRLYVIQLLILYVYVRRITKHSTDIIVLVNTVNGVTKVLYEKQNALSLLILCCNLWYIQV